ncbi:lytic polysaccharide monooxygenase [Cylindrobasidium torrendii FP15055 ss-10]|uniref:AA9 family lytic polysaccharide monooxygenase n=1 Tax=Cylindrobasidium torrendii FP15055 ss-10 TaxID=1314674 RepID=A0A0D7AYB6_9AGAR|nr:lytic polysaccharide monooxygenase [Cylindrobasidium torrendii FP15055 ss-10]
MLQLASVALLASTVAGHAIFQEIYLDGTSQGHLEGIRVPGSNNPVQDVTLNDIICNIGTTSSNTVIPVKAGQEITAELHHGLSGADPNDGDDPIAASHKGPILAYLAKVDDAASAAVTGLEWFKIFEDGYDSGTWAVDKLIENEGKVSFTLPTCVPDGQYLLRLELIALHGASTYPGAQFYMSCAQIEVSGGGSGSATTVAFPGAYKGADPGITINIYGDISEYTIPGPTVLSC